MPNPNQPDRRGALSAGFAVLGALVMPSVDAQEQKPTPDQANTKSLKATIGALKNKVEKKEKIGAPDINVVVDAMYDGNEMRAFFNSQKALTAATKAEKNASDALKKAKNDNRGNSLKSEAQMKAEKSFQDAVKERTAALEEMRKARSVLVGQQDEILRLVQSGKLPTAAVREVAKPMSDALKVALPRPVGELEDGSAAHQKASFIRVFQVSFVDAANRLK
jgi:hypothetical protein